MSVNQISNLHTNIPDPIVEHRIVILLALTGAALAAHCVFSRKDQVEIPQKPKLTALDLVAADDSGARAIHVAAAASDLDTIENLHRRGADLNVKDNNGFAPIHYAADKGEVLAIRLLHTFGVDLNAVSNVVRTAMHLAAENGHTGAVSELEKLGAKLRVIDYNNDTPLTLAIKEGWVDLIPVIGLKGITENPCPMERAMRKGDVDAISALKELGLQPSMSLVILHQPDMIGELFEPGVQITAMDLSVVVETGQVETLSKVVKNHEIDLDEEVVFGKTLINVALENGQPETADLLVELGAQIDGKEGGPIPIFRAVEIGSIENITTLLEKGADPSKTQENGKTLLHFAAKTPKRETIEFLHENKATLDAVDLKGDTPLHLAVGCSNVEAVRAFLDLGANPSLQNEKGQTPLHKAATQWSSNIASLLCEKMEDLDVQDTDGKTPLELAIDLNKLEMAYLLIKKGAGNDALKTRLEEMSKQISEPVSWRSRPVENKR